MNILSLVRVMIESDDIEDNICVQDLFFTGDITSGSTVVGNQMIVKILLLISSMGKVL